MIKYIIALNEKENEELNYFQSTDFNAGVIYTNLDKAMGSLLIGDITSIEKDLDQVFNLTDKENEVYRCLYCESSLKNKE